MKGQLHASVALYPDTHWGEGSVVLKIRSERYDVEKNAGSGGNRNQVVHAHASHRIVLIHEDNIGSFVK